MARKLFTSDKVLQENFAAKNFYQIINIKIKRGNEKSVLPYVEKLWTSFRSTFMIVNSLIKQ
jgi:hypothetical protein